MKCYLCNLEAQAEVKDSGNLIICPACGKYIAPYLWDMKPRDEVIPYPHLLGGFLHETNNRERPDNLTEKRVEQILQSPLIPKTSIQKLDKILLSLYKSGEGFAIEFNSQDLTPTMGYVQTQVELSKMLDALCELGYIKSTLMYIDGERYTITIKGLERAESLLTEQNFSKRAFIAMRFSDDLKEVRDKSIKPACEACGFEAYTVDEEEHVGDITDKIISGIKTSRFVIADFTYNNPGVYYEAGYAKGLGIPVIKTCKKEWFESKDEKGEKNRLHFDVEHDNMILWENAEDLRQRLESRIQAVIL